MRTKRSEFSTAAQLEIIRRATDSSGRVHCTHCGVWCKGRSAYELHHVTPEGLQLVKARRTAASGAVLCLACHREQTGPDLAAIAQAKRREARALGIKTKHRPSKQPLRTAAGVTEIARRYRLENDNGGVRQLEDEGAVIRRR